MMIKEAIRKVLAGEHLTPKEAHQVMGTIMSGEATPAQIGGLLIALKQKGEHAQEVAGFVRSMREHAVPVMVNDMDAVDGCGTGGDGTHSFNISTAASIVTAASGVTVAKHGNRSVSSKCGSADLLEACEGNIDPGPEVVRDNINQIGFGFIYAPRFHPSMKHAAGPRRDLGIRTVFNILGPMTNPAAVKRQVVGVFHKSVIGLMAEVLETTGSQHVLVAHSRDGLDEFSISAPTDFVEVHHGKRTEASIRPEDCGLRSHPEGSVGGGDGAYNRRIFERLLEGEDGPCRDAVLLNAGAMIYVAGQAESIREGVVTARNAVDDGSAKQKLQQWVTASTE
jgi:anthranilate phosphoribosyltransferase